jgi:hypothetical protein
VANNWEIAPVLNQLFKSQHFYDMANRGVYIKSPFDLVIGSLRTFNLNYTVTDATTLKRNIEFGITFQQCFNRLRTNYGENSKCFRLLLFIKIHPFMNIGSIPVPHKKDSIS